MALLEVENLRAGYGATVANFVAECQSLFEIACRSIKLVLIESKNAQAVQTQINTAPVV